jgi:small subunit ribosomal protein S14
MAKTSMIERQKKRVALVDKYAARRAELKAVARNESLPMEQRFNAQLKLAKLPRNSSATRLHNRCEVTGRPRSYYRKLRMSRIALRDLASKGQVPGMVKSSW